MTVHWTAALEAWNTRDRAGKATLMIAVSMAPTNMLVT